MRDVAADQELLIWYDQHARALPWRVPPHQSRAGVRPDPYAVWMSEIMLQQTTVAAVKSYFEVFTRRWPRVQDLADAEDADVMAAWAGLGYYARARNLLKCARTVVADHGGVFPSERSELQKLPGIGPYTSAAIASIAFGQRETVVDGNVERVMARMFNVTTPLPSAKPILTDLAEGLTPADRPGDYAQAVMDLGATICTPKRPVCSLCPWTARCDARATGDPTDLPRKTPKAPKPTRTGIAYVVQRPDGALLLEQRPPKGLLGGMLGWPGSDWSEAPTPAPPLAGEWLVLNEQARHTFTHFHLVLDVHILKDAPMSQIQRGTFVPLAEFSDKALPTVMRKVFQLARPHLAPFRTADRPKVTT